MALRDWIHDSGQVATATPATTATPTTREPRNVATVATVSVARDEKTEKLATVGIIPIVDWLIPCPICHGHLFNHSNRGGFFCVVCQPMPAEHRARLVRSRPPVRATRYDCGCGTNSYISNTGAGPWLCEGCGGVYDIIGGTRGPNLLSQAGRST